MNSLIGLLVNCPHRLEAQDSALSRRQQGFDSPWGRHQKDFFIPSFHSLIILCKIVFLELEFFQLKNLNFKFTVHGDVAHLVERNAGSVEVRGSIPLVSTNFLCNPLQIQGLQIKIQICLTPYLLQTQFNHYFNHDFNHDLLLRFRVLGR